MNSSMVAMKMSSNDSHDQHHHQLQNPAPHLCFKTLSLKRDRNTAPRSEVINNIHTNDETASFYRECQKNHAAAIGGHALDGCGEYMPSSPSLKCAACGCHRNFHRLHSPEPINSVKTPSPNLAAAPLFSHRPRRFSSTSPSTSSSPSRSEAPISSIYPSAPQILMTLSSGAEHVSLPTPPDSHKLCFVDADPKSDKLQQQQSLNSKKRFRTKFSAEQKEKMRRFADGLGWRMQRSDDEGVRRFCDEIGVCKSVLKVWMHNNKSRNTFGGAGEFEIGRSREEEEMMMGGGEGVAGNNGGKQSIDGGSSSSA